MSRRRFTDAIPAYKPILGVVAGQQGGAGLLFEDELIDLPPEILTFAEACELMTWQEQAGYNAPAVS